MARFKRKRIALLFAGGTLLSRNPKPWEFVRTPSDMRRWIDSVVELNVIADLEPVFVTGKPASDIGSTEWITLAEHIRSLVNRVDGVVVLHGLETLHYTANALSLMTQNLPISVVLSGSPIRASKIKQGQLEFGARANIINAVQAACTDLTDVSVVFGNRIMHASRVQPATFGLHFQLTTVDGSFIGRVDFGTKLFPENPARSKRKPRWAIHADPNIVVMSVTPASDVAPFHRAVEASVHAILLQTTEDFLTLPEQVSRELEQGVRKGTVVVVNSPHPLHSLPKFVIPFAGISQSMSVVKLMWALGGSRSPQRIRRLLDQNVAGEFVTSRTTP